MVSTSNATTYQPAAAYQGNHAQAERQQQRTEQTQPRNAPSSNSQRADRRTHSDDGPKQAAHRDAEKTQDSKSSYHGSRGKSVDVKA